MDPNEGEVVWMFDTCTMCNRLNLSPPAFGRGCRGT